MTRRRLSKKVSPAQSVAGEVRGWLRQGLRNEANRVANRYVYFKDGVEQYFGDRGCTIRLNKLWVQGIELRGSDWVRKSDWVEAHSN